MLGLMLSHTLKYGLKAYGIRNERKNISITMQHLQTNTIKYLYTQ